MSITEPMTMATDYLLAVLLVVWALRLQRHARQRGSRATALWALVFAATTVAAVAGGTYHGFREVLSTGLFDGLIKVTLYTIVIASWSLLSAATLCTLRARSQRVVLIVAALKLLGFAVWMITHNEFRYAIYDYVPALVVVLAFQIYAWKSAQAPAAPWIIAGIVISFVAAGVQISGVQFHRYFNHNDLYHVVQMVAFYLLYRGGMLLEERR